MEFLRVWPIGKFPVLRDEARAKTIPESTIIIEYLAQNYPGRVKLVPEDPALAWQARLRAPTAWSWLRRRCSRPTA